MKYFNKYIILEAVNRGIQLALDDYQDIEPNSSISSDVINTEDVILKYQLKSMIYEYKVISNTQVNAISRFCKQNNIKYKVKNRDELDDIIMYKLKLECKQKNKNDYYWLDKYKPVYYDLNWLDISNVDDLGYVFAETKFSGDISEWDVSHVINMEYMFADSLFNGNIGNWDVSHVKTMKGMFQNNLVFDQDISKWNVSRVEDMSYMFDSVCTKFNQDISSWDVSCVKNMSHMFEGCAYFNQPIGKWDVSGVKNMSCMFSGNNVIFNSDISSWDVSGVKNMSCMFYFNWNFKQDISNWKISDDCDVYAMFYYATKMKNEFKPIGGFIGKH